MADIASQLKEHFWTYEYDLLELWDLLGFPPDGKTDPDWTEAEERAVAIFKVCRQSVDSIPDDVMRATKKLSEDRTAIFEQTATSLTRAIGVSFFPATATEFVKELVARSA
jgi:hypothetical protein